MAQLNSLILFLIFISQFFLSQSFNFTYNGFNDSNNPELIQEGAIVIKPSGALRLTDKIPNTIGHAFYPSQINISTNTSFSTYFIFQIRPSQDRGGYGLAFVISPSPQLHGADGHYFGVFNESNNGKSSNHIFMVEFDTVNGYGQNSDTDGNHVSVNINGMDSNRTLIASYFDDGTGHKQEDMDMENGQPIQAWVDYDGINKIVNVTISPLHVLKPIIPLIRFPVNLSDVFVENMYVGFSAATGRKSSSHYILGWSFRLNEAADDSLDLNRLPVVPMDKSDSSKVGWKNALISTFSVLLFILLVSLAIIISYRRVTKFEILEEWEMDCPHRFRYRDLYKATKGFKESEIIGTGGFGSVYKGVLPKSGVEIAVKKIMSKNSIQGMREFAAEIESLGRLRHKHLVNLQGWCKHRNDLHLIYDYVSNGSLDSLLFNSKNGVFLNWDQRFNIIKGIASGLLYLHEEWEQVVIHRDIKSSNVLIDQDMNARLGDFGLARLYDHGKISHTTKVVGTIGYISPEMTQIGHASTSSDVFAYGILLLEVACGRKPIVYDAEDRHVILVDWVVECLKIGKIFDAVDARLKSMYDVEEMELVLGLGLLCSHPKVEARPTMREVMKFLNREIEIVHVFDKLSLAGSRRIDELISTLLNLGISDSSDTTTLLYSSSVGQMSSSSISIGR